MKEGSKDIPMLNKRQGETFDESTALRLTGFQRFAVNALIASKGLQANRGPCESWMMERLRALCSNAQTLVIEDSTCRRSIPLTVPHEQRIGSYMLPYGSVCVCVEGGCRREANMNIEKLEDYGLVNAAENAKVNQTQICQADSTREANFLASGDAWIAAGGQDETRQ